MSLSLPTEAFRTTPFIPAVNQSAKDARLSGAHLRHHPDSRDKRCESERDRDRILYSQGFLRLGGVTQILPPDSANPRMHTRMTHSLKVAQVARALAEQLIHEASKDPLQVQRIQRLGGLDPFVAEAAGLAHDLGHPPFGHAGEVVLDELCNDDHLLHVDDGFEGNAQSFRIATKTDGSYGYRFGLDLTAGTRAALLKYPWFREEPITKGRKGSSLLRKKKFGYYYSTEREQFNKSREWLNETSPRIEGQTLEASIMDIADDITYAIHDLEDFLTMGIINREEMLYHCAAYLPDDPTVDMGGQNTLANRVSVLNELARRLEDHFGDRFNAAHLQRAARTLLEQVALPTPDSKPASLREWRSHWITTLLDSVRVLEAPAGDTYAYLQVRDYEWHLIELFKFFAKAFVVNRRDTGLMQFGEASILRSAMSSLRVWERAEGGMSDSSRIPVRLYQHLDWCRHYGESRDRAFLDYLCSLGDAEVEALAAAMSGHRVTGLWAGPRL